MTKPEQYVKKHVDSDDISHQYALALGNYSGANLRCYDENDNVLGDFDYHRKICKMDGRLPHELIQDNFKGKRFCVIWFKLKKVQARTLESWRTVEQQARKCGC